MKTKKVRPLGIVLLELETVLNEMVDHDLQWADVLFIVYGWLQVHNPDGKEIYEDGSSPVLKYE